MQKNSNKNTKNNKFNTTNRFALAKQYLMEKFEIRKNVISHELEYRNRNKGEFITLNEHTIYVNMQIDNVNINFANLIALFKSDMVEEFNPFIDYFEHLPKWNMEVDYIQKLAAYVIVNDNDRQRFDIQFRKWIVRTIKCALIDGYFNKQAFILVQEKQNSGKSTFCRFMCPPKLSNYIAENISVDKDSRILLTSNFLINLDELSTLSKVEINALKSMFSKDKINDRLPYERKNSIIPRRASIIGSTNQSEFLNDESGSVRWLCFEISGINWKYKTEIDIDLVYSQAYYLFQNGFKAELTQTEIAANDEINKSFQILTSERELIHKYLISVEKGDEYAIFMTATDIMVYLHQVSNDSIKLFPSNIGKALKQLNFTRSKNGIEKIFGYWVKKREGHQTNSLFNQATN